MVRVYLAVLLVMGGYWGAQSQAAQGVFENAPGAPVAPEYIRQDTGVKRVRAVRLSLALFRGSKPQKSVMNMNFFPNATLPVQWTGVDAATPGQVIWTGSVKGAKYGHAVLTVSGKFFTGNFSRGDGIVYQIRTSEDGLIWVREVDQKAFHE